MVLYVHVAIMVVEIICIICVGERWVYHRARLPGKWDIADLTATNCEAIHR